MKPELAPKLLTLPRNGLMRSYLRQHVSSNEEFSSIILESRREFDIVSRASTTDVEILNYLRVNSEFSVNRLILAANPTARTGSLVERWWADVCDVPPTAWYLHEDLLGCPDYLKTMDILHYIAESNPTLWDRVGDLEFIAAAFGAHSTQQFSEFFLPTLTPGSAAPISFDTFTGMRVRTQMPNEAFVLLDEAWRGASSQSFADCLDNVARPYIEAAGLPVNTNLVAREFLTQLALSLWSFEAYSTPFGWGGSPLIQELERAAGSGLVSYLSTLAFHEVSNFNQIVEGLFVWSGSSDVLLTRITGLSGVEFWSLYTRILFQYNSNPEFWSIAFQNKRLSSLCDALSMLLCNNLPEIGRTTPPGPVAFTPEVLGEWFNSTFTQYFLTFGGMSLLPEELFSRYLRRYTVQYGWDADLIVDPLSMPVEVVQSPVASSSGAEVSDDNQVLPVSPDFESAVTADDPHAASLSNLSSWILETAPNIESQDSRLGALDVEWVPPFFRTSVNRRGLIHIAPLPDSESLVILDDPRAASLSNLSSWILETVPNIESQYSPLVVPPAVPVHLLCHRRSLDDLPVLGGGVLENLSTQVSALPLVIDLRLRSVSNVKPLVVSKPSGNPGSGSGGGPDPGLGPDFGPQPFPDLGSCWFGWVTGWFIVVCGALLVSWCCTGIVKAYTMTALSKSAAGLASLAAYTSNPTAAAIFKETSTVVESYATLFSTYDSVFGESLWLIFEKTYLLPCTSTSAGLILFALLISRLASHYFTVMQKYHSKK